MFDNDNLPEFNELQDIFIYAGQTLGERVLKDRYLEWKPSIKDLLLNQIKDAKGAVKKEHTKLNQQWESPRSGFQIGGHRGASTSPNIGGHRGVPPPQNKFISDAKKAAIRCGTPQEVANLLREGVNSATDPLKPDTNQLINGIAEMLKESGLLENGLIDSGTEIATEVASCLPVIGAVATMTQATTQSFKAIKQKFTAYKLDHFNDKKYIIRPGQPEAALEAVASIYDRKAKELSGRATVGWSAGGVQVAGLFVDLGGATGPLTGFVKATLNLFITIASSCIVLREMRIGNEILMRINNQSPQIEIGGHRGKGDKKREQINELLIKSPIVGAYLLTEAESSTLYAFLVSGPLPENWQDEVENLKPKFEKVIRKANKIQRDYPFRLSGGTKGDHYLDTRFRKLHKRIPYEAKGNLKRNDPRANDFLFKHAKATTR